MGLFLTLWLLTTFPLMPGLSERMSMKVITYLIFYITTQLISSLKCILPTLMEPMKLIFPFFIFSVINLHLVIRIFMSPLADHYTFFNIIFTTSIYITYPFENALLLFLSCA